MSNRTTSAAWIKGLRDLFQHEGLDVKELFGEAGLDLAGLDSPGMRCPTDKVSRLWQLAVQRSRNPLIGIAQPRSSPLVCFDVVGYAMMSCPNLLASLECLVRYLHVVSDAVTLALRKDVQDYCVELSVYGNDIVVPRQRCEFDLLTLLCFLHWISGRRFSPVRVEFAYPAPARPQAYDEAFACPVRFDAPANRLLLSAADLRLPLSTHNPVLEKFHAEFACQSLSRLDNRGTSRKVRDLIAHKLLGWEPRREEIARLLCLGDRTLRRRLEEEGTSFQKILDETRRELAQQYLAQQRYSVGEIAHMLGFADQGTLFRACRRWFDVSPKQYQARYQA
jgi:AraC-like DNA-binding protein